LKSNKLAVLLVERPREDDHVPLWSLCELSLNPVHRDTVARCELRNFNHFNPEPLNRTRNDALLVTKHENA